VDFIWVTTPSVPRERCHEDVGYLALVPPRARKAGVVFFDATPESAFDGLSVGGGGVSEETPALLCRSVLPCSFITATMDANWRLWDPYYLMWNPRRDGIYMTKGVTGHGPDIMIYNPMNPWYLVKVIGFGVKVAKLGAKMAKTLMAVSKMLMKFMKLLWKFVKTLVTAIVRFVKLLTSVADRLGKIISNSVKMAAKFSKSVGHMMEGIAHTIKNSAEFQAKVAVKAAEISHKILAGLGPDALKLMITVSKVATKLSMQCASAVGKVAVAAGKGIAGESTGGVADDAAMAAMCTFGLAALFAAITAILLQKGVSAAVVGAVMYKLRQTMLSGGVIKAKHVAGPVAVHAGAYQRLVDEVTSKSRATTDGQGRAFSGKQQKATSYHHVGSFLGEAPAAMSSAAVSDLPWTPEAPSRYHAFAKSRSFLSVQLDMS